ncbi:hypothetical protein D3C85_1588860 [compost metagenome]
MQGKHAQVRCKAFCLIEPVRDEAGGHYRQGGPIEAAAFLLQQQMGQRLQGLAQAHVVTQDAAGVDVPQGLQPGEALQLVMTEFGIQTLGRSDGDLAAVAQFACQFA